MAFMKMSQSRKMTLIVCLWFVPMTIKCSNLWLEAKKTHSGLEPRWCPNKLQRLDTYIGLAINRVTKLGYYWKVLLPNFIAKVAKRFGNFEKHPFCSKNYQLWLPICLGIFEKRANSYLHILSHWRLETLQSKHGQPVANLINIVIYDPREVFSSQARL